MTNQQITEFVEHERAYWKEIHEKQAFIATRLFKALDIIEMQARQIGEYGEQLKQIQERAKAGQEHDGAHHKDEYLFNIEQRCKHTLEQADAIAAEMDASK